MSEGSLELERYFAAQKLAGGQYIGHRFQRAKSAQDYRPYVLTTPGSVFVLKATDSDTAEKLIRTWKSSGLPLSPHLTTNGEPEFWQCPFRPQEGFGEFAVNLAVHQSHKPAEREPEYLK